MSWQSYEDIDEKHLEIQEEDSELLKTAKNLISYILDVDDKSSDFKQGWVEGIDQLITEIEGRKDED